MESFEAIINAEKFVIVHNDPEPFTFTVFNYSTCYVIKKSESGTWEPVKHRFGTVDLPLVEIGEAINKHYVQLKLTANDIPDSRSA